MRLPSKVFRSCYRCSAASNQMAVTARLLENLLHRLHHPFDYPKVVIFTKGFACEICLVSCGWVDWNTWSTSRNFHTTALSDACFVRVAAFNLCGMWQILIFGKWYLAIFLTFHQLGGTLSCMLLFVRALALCTDILWQTWIDWCSLWSSPWWLLIQVVVWQFACWSCRWYYVWQFTCRSCH
jgi:hypothetical protein